MIALKQVKCKANTQKGSIEIEPSSKDTILNELENLSAAITVTFDKNISIDDIMLIIFVNSGEVEPAKMERVKDNQFTVPIPRKVMQKGRLYFTVQHYDKDLVQLTKYTPETYLYVNKSLDISVDVGNKHPDIFAELYYRIGQLEEKVFKKGLD